MRYIFAMAFLVAALFGGSAANATVSVAIDLTHQRMDVTSASGSYSWPISSGRAGYNTPTGVFHPQAMYTMVHSAIYNNAPMPHSIFFSGGYAIHGTNATGALGRPASHGCIRLAPGNAAALFRMVKAEGASITISGSAGGSRLVASHHRAGHAVHVAHGHLMKRYMALAKHHPIKHKTLPRHGLI